MDLKGKEFIEWLTNGEVNAATYFYSYDFPDFHYNWLRLTDNSIICKYNKFLHKTISIYIKMFYNDKTFEGFIIDLIENNYYKFSRDLIILEIHDADYNIVKYLIDKKIINKLVPIINELFIYFSEFPVYKLIEDVIYTEKKTLRYSWLISVYKCRLT